MHGIVGPTGRGIVVASPEQRDADADRQWIEKAGLPAAFPRDLGLSAMSAPPPEDVPAHATYWSTVTRRPAVVRDRGRTALATPDGQVGTEEGRPPERALAAAMDRTAGPRVTTFGGAWIEEGEPEYAEARRFGELCARGGIEVANGGYGGIMAAVSRGAAEAGGRALGVTITSFSEVVQVNGWLTHEVQAADLFARLPLLCDAEAWVAFPGGVGTLSEVALCWNLVQTESVSPRPLVIVGERWDQALRAFRKLLIAEGLHFDLLRPAEDAEGAFEIVRRLIS